MLFDGKEAQALPIAERQVGMVFQHYALFGHMSVFNNVAFGLKVRSRKSRPPRKVKLRSAWSDCCISSSSMGSATVFRRSSRAGSASASRLPGRLRPSPRCCCSTNPSEPSTRRSGLSCAAGCATCTIRLASMGTPTEVYEGPQSPFVYDFLGRTNAFDCVIERGQARLGDKEFPVDGLADGPAIAFVRPHDVVLCRLDDAEPSEDAKLPDAATVRLVTALGPKAWVELSYVSQVVAAEITREALAKLRLQPGSRCTLQLRLPCFFARR